MIVRLPNLTIDTAEIQNLYGCSALPFIAVEVQSAKDKIFNEVITAADLLTVWNTIKSRREYEGWDSTWVLIPPSDQAFIVPGMDFPVEEWFPYWANTCKLLARVNHYTQDEYEIALRRIPLEAK